MPWNQVMDKWKSGKLHSGSPAGPIVHNQKRAVAIMLSEKRAAQGGKDEYKADTSHPINKLRMRKKKGAF